MKKIHALSAAVVLSFASAAAFAGGGSGGFGSVSSPNSGLAAAGISASALNSSSISNASGGFSASLTAPGHIDASVTQGNQSFSNASLTFGASQENSVGYANTYANDPNGQPYQTGSTTTNTWTTTAGFTTATQTGSENFSDSVINTAFTPVSEGGGFFSGGGAQNYGGSFSDYTTGSGNGTATADGGAVLAGVGVDGTITGGFHW
ncbi:hypothetical protein CY652_19850 [Burkholderia sp. WAC0059]|uniref:hypothetical protein n=1 Tax=Burkholderia sp. WAC0059 TaxID=2066022 RepID=UPI000C7F6BB2|nr:hypothetical protein [Burkholderia sp. WAC0059]PLZ00713.1 hypothetical protein CY652_19850 [Burkholderia sp. WAC0059]